MPKNEFGDEISQPLITTNPTQAPTHNEFGDKLLSMEDLSRLTSPAYERPLRNEAIDFSRPIVDDATKAGVTALTKSPTAGYLSYAVMDALMQHLKSGNEQGLLSQILNTKPNESLAGNIENTVLNTGEQYGIGKLTDYFGNAANRSVAGVRNVIANKGANADLARFGATYSQYLDPNSFRGRLAANIEDIFARRSKMSAQERAGFNILNEGKSDAASFAGRSVNTVTNPELHAQLLQQEAIANKKELDDAFDQFTTEAKFYKPQFSRTQPVVTGHASPLKQINPNYDPQKYQDAIDNANAVAKLHDSIFDPSMDKGGISGLVNDPNNTAVPFIRRILADPQKLERAIKSSSLPIPGGSITSPQLKKDLQGYYLNDIIDQASKRDDITNKIVGIDTQKLNDIYNDPHMIESVKQLFTANERSDLQQFFKNAAKTQQKMMAGFSTGAKVYLGVSGLEMAASLFSGNTKWGIIGAAPYAVRLSGAALGKMMTNPTLARTLVQLSSGQPTGMASKMLGEAISKALNGEVINMVDSNGQEHEGKLDNGEFVPTGK